MLIWNYQKKFHSYKSISNFSFFENIHEQWLCTMFLMVLKKLLLLVSGSSIIYNLFNRLVMETAWSIYNLNSIDAECCCRLIYDFIIEANSLYVHIIFFGRLILDRYTFLERKNVRSFHSTSYKLSRQSNNRLH